MVETRPGGPLRGVLFDLDGTLIDTAPGLAAALSRISLSRGGGDVDLARVRSAVSLGAEDLVRITLGPQAVGAAVDVAALRHELGTAEQVEERLFPGVAPLLDQLTRSGTLMAVVTNKPEALSRKLLSALCGVTRFEAVIGGDTCARCKPDPEPVYAALDMMGLSPDAALLVGDSGVDAAAARAADVPFWLFTGGYGAAECPPDLMSRSFDHFDALSSALAAAIEGEAANEVASSHAI